MERPLIPLLILLVLAASLPGSALAEPTVHTFALVIANNRSAASSQPDLQYADDDGARYYRLFRSIAAEPDVVLLTNFDRASQLAYGPLTEAARPPSQSELLAARDRLGRAIGRAKAAGEQTVLYLLYAGHGEMRDGRGLLDLDDTQIDGAFIERELLDRLPADAKHVLLDSCNSFFVMNPRKPGGKRWATPQDMAFGFSARHPEVGLFLSTNSESEVYEWSELESGVFSHEVRSGLSGGADADQSGDISYLELAGFIDRANRGIARESLRPHLFFRGPHGNPQASLFPTEAMRGRRVVLGSGAQRLWIKSASGERLLDVHKEAMPMTLVLPEGETYAVTLYEQTKSPGERVEVSERGAPAAREPLLVSSLGAAAPTLAARGNQLFGSLFAEPFGPLSLAAYAEESKREPEPVFGLTAADVTRMHNYVSSLHDLGRARRMRTGAVYLAGGAVAAAFTTALAVHFEHGDPSAALATSAAFSAVGLGLGLRLTLSPSSGERALGTFERELSRKQGARAFVETDQYLTRMAKREHQARMRQSLVLYALSAVPLATGIGAAFSSAHGEEEQQSRTMMSVLLFSEAAVILTLGTLVRLFETPTESALRLYREDPGLKLRFGGSVSHNAVQIGLSGTF